MNRFIGTLRILLPLVPDNAMQWRLSRFVPNKTRRYHNDNSWHPLGAA